MNWRRLGNWAEIGGRMLAAAVLTAALTGCGGQAEGGIGAAGPPVATGVETMAVTPAVTPPPLTAEDTETGWDETATQVRFDGETISVDGAGASVDGRVLTVGAGGVYVLRGTLTDGQVLVAAAETDTVRLVLDGARIENTTGAPLYAASADKLIVTLAAGTENTLTDGGAQFAYADAAAEEPDAALFSKCDLTLNGEGTLTVDAGFGNGIGTKDDLVVAGGAFVVRAARHGLRGRDSVAVHGGSFQITAGGDGVQANNDEDAAKGWVALLGGRFAIESAHDAVQAETALHIEDGQFEIVAGGGHDAAPATADGSDSSDSYKGIKAAGNLTVAGGTFQIDSADDCLHTNGSAVIGGGTLLLYTGDDGVHADGALTIGGGRVEVCASYEGLEGATVDITGGTVTLEASDDGINAAGGSSRGADGTANRFGRDVFGAGGGAYAIRISGGAVTLHAGGDGLDSNGTIHISGGQVVSVVDSTADNGALDCEGALTVTGGTLVYGGTGTGAGFGEDSTQSYVYLAAPVPAGAAVEVLKDGTSLLTHQTAHALAVLAVSTPEIVSGEEYEIAVDGTKTAVTAGSGGSGFGPGGGGGFGGGRPPGGGGDARPGGGEFGGMPEGMDRETLRQAWEIIAEAQEGALTDEQRARLSALGLTDEQIDRLLAMPGPGGGFPNGGGPPDGVRPGDRPAPSPASPA
ncbi:MAG: carbohydrate-binding domain-containing protein [Oscillospiraceae bacterium]|nr:carbohydrate-binding domain-containing protein [Oscillospiraceae bacterium]